MAIAVEKCALSEVMARRVRERLDVINAAVDEQIDAWAASMGFPPGQWRAHYVAVIHVMCDSTGEPRTAVVEMCARENGASN